MGALRTVPEWGPAKTLSIAGNKGSSTPPGPLRPYGFSSGLTGRPCGGILQQVRQSRIGTYRPRRFTSNYNRQP
jgi:hypothetical protein